MRLPLRGCRAPYRAVPIPRRSNRSRRIEELRICQDLVAQAFLDGSACDKHTGASFPWQAERVMSLEDERALRYEAMAWLAVRTHDGRDPISRTDLTQFSFRGERLTLIDAGRGIRKPRQCRAALTIMTVHTPSGRRRVYEDIDGPDGHPRYKMRADKRGAAENTAVIRALELQLPIIWLVGVDAGWFQTVFPVYVIGFEPENDQFVLAYDNAQILPLPASPLEEVLRQYAVRETRQRLHQPVFRSMVIRAYKTKCAVCSLGHSPLLDAAHIIADAEEAGVAAVPNGLALCKIHHAAYDAGILGITPDYIVHIRDDILVEVDGPLLEHGLKGLHGERLMVLPARYTDRPDPELLEVRYSRFRTA